MGERLVGGSTPVEQTSDSFILRYIAAANNHDVTVYLTLLLIKIDHPPRICHSRIPVRDGLHPNS